MRANFWQKYLIIICSLRETIVASCKIWFVAVSDKKNARHKIDLLLRHWVKKMLKIVKLTFTLHDPYNLQYEPNKVYIIMSNHCGHYDIPLILAALPGSIRMITKKELFRVPLWGNAMQAAEFVSIDRENRRQAILDLQNAKKKMLSGIRIWVAPEGTRTRTGELQDFKKGGFMLALKTEATIIPVTICGSGKVLPPKTWDFNIGLHADIYIQKPIDTTQYTIKDIDKLMQLVRDSIKEKLPHS